MMPAAGPELEWPAGADITDMKQCKQIVISLWKLSDDVSLGGAYTFLSRLLLPGSCLSIHNLAYDAEARELAAKACILLMRWGYLASFLSEVRNVSLDWQCSVLGVLCTIPVVQENVVALIVMELWDVDRTASLKGILILGYQARRHALQYVLKFLSASATFDHNSIRAQQDLLARALVRLGAYSRLCAILEDEHGHRGFRIMCLEAVMKSIPSSMQPCAACQPEAELPLILCPHAGTVSVEVTGSGTMMVTDDAIILSLDEVYVYLNLSHDTLVTYSACTWVNAGANDNDFPAIDLPSATRVYTPRSSTLRLGDLEQHSIGTEMHRRSRDDTRKSVHHDRSGIQQFAEDASIVPYCQAQTLDDRTCTALLNTLRQCAKSANEGVVTCAIASITKILTCLVGHPSNHYKNLPARLRSVDAIYFIECVLDYLQSASTAIKEVTVISLGTLLVAYYPYLHETVAMGLFYSVFNVALAEANPKLRNCCFLTIRYIYSSIAVNPRTLLHKQTDVGQLISLFLTSTSSKHIIAECICLVNRAGRQFLMQNAQRDVNTRNRMLCIGALKCLAVSALEDIEFVDLKRFLVGILAETNTLVQVAALDLYGYLYAVLCCPNSSDACDTCAADADLTNFPVHTTPVAVSEGDLDTQHILALSSLTPAEKQRLAAFRANPVITHVSFCATMAARLSDTKLSANTEAYTAIVRTLQTYADQKTVCGLLADAILINRQSEKVLPVLLNAFAGYHPQNVREYAYLFYKCLDVQLYKKLDNRFPYASPDVFRYALKLTQDEQGFSEVVRLVSERHRGSLKFTKWCRDLQSSLSV